MMKDVGLNTDSAVNKEDGRDEVGISAGDVGDNTLFNGDADVEKNQLKYASTIATRMKRQPMKHEQKTMMNLQINNILFRI